MHAVHETDNCWTGKSKKTPPFNSLLGTEYIFSTLAMIQLGALLLPLCGKAAFPTLYETKNFYFYLFPLRLLSKKNKCDNYLANGDHAVRIAMTASNQWIHFCQTNAKFGSELFKPHLHFFPRCHLMSFKVTGLYFRITINMQEKCLLILFKCVNLSTTASKLPSKTETMYLRGTVVTSSQTHWQVHGAGAQQAERAGVRDWGEQ